MRERPLACVTHLDRQYLRATGKDTQDLENPVPGNYGTGGTSAMNVKYMLPFTPHFTNIQEGPVDLSTGYHHGLDTPQSSPHKTNINLSYLSSYLLFR